MLRESMQRVMASVIALAAVCTVVITLMSGKHTPSVRDSERLAQLWGGFSNLHEQPATPLPAWQQELLADPGWDQPSR